MEPKLRLVDGSPTLQSPDAPAPRVGPSDDAHINLRLLRPLARYLRESQSPEVLEAVAATIARAPADFEGRSVWISTEEFERVLVAARERLEDDDELKRACIYRMPDEYGPLRFVVQATTPLRLFRQAARNFHVISRVGTLAVERAGPNRIRIKYGSSAPEGRLTCLSRQAQMAVAPTLWGLPQAHLEEHGCVAKGDPECVYELRLYQSWRWLPILGGAALGAGLGALLLYLQMQAISAVLSVLFGGLLGYALEVRRTHRANLAMGDEANDVLRRLSHEEAEARVEIIDLHRRQRRWTQLLEEQLSQRAGTIEDVLGEAQRVSEDRVKTLRGMSHDLNNPLMVLLSSLSLLEMNGANPAVTRDMQLAIDQMRALLRVMVTNLAGGVNVPWTHQALDVAATTEQLRARMKALVFGREIRVSVFRSREAPETIRCDSTLFDRVVDNLFTNAAKYTLTGSIVVEVGGTPGYLTLKVSDTGRGIPTDQIARIFVAGGSDESRRAKGSFGVGLSVVVNLLAKIGGQLEVMSKEDIGTTFWAHFPIEPLETSGEPDSTEAQLGRVLTIRRNIDN